jgi:hypothetical protein
MTTGKFPTRREHPRVSVELEVTVAIADVRFAARTRDMSRAGLCLIAEQPLTRDAEISLELVLKFGDEGASEPLKLVGRVAWCTALFGKYQIGVKFVKLDDELGRYLDMFVGFMDGTLGPGDVFGGEEAAFTADPDDPFAA